MKKKKLFLFPIMLLVGILFSVFTINVNAAQLNLHYKDGVYFARFGNGGPYTSMAFPFYEIDGKITYCIQPNVEITGYNYQYIDVNTPLPYSNEIKTKVQLIGHYGYEYPGHQTDNYRIATQQLIWELTSGQEVQLWTQRYEEGTRIYVDAEKAEIMRLVNSHSTKPSFNGASVDTLIGREVMFEDTNNVLDNFSILSSNGTNARIEGNKLYINPSSTGNINISLIKNGYDREVFTLYKGTDGSQIQGILRSSDPVLASVNLNVSGGKLKITKLDKDTNQPIPQGQAEIKGAVYEVFNSNNEVVSTLTIGDDGTAETDYLPLGTYTIKEKISSKGYLLDYTSYTANITSGETVSVNVYEDVIKAKVKVVKYDSETNSCVPQGEASLSGAKYGVYDWNKQLIGTITINNDCSALTDFLPYGKYQIQEIQNPVGYKLDTTKFDIDITSTDEIEITSIEDVIKNKFNFYKFYGNDSDTHIYTEANATFYVYDKNNQVFTTFKTDSNGYANIILPYGKYQVIQQTGQDKYKLAEPFEIVVSETTNEDQTNYLLNDEVKAKLKLIKIDTDTGEEIKLSGFKFKIYDTKTNQYVCQTTNETVCEYQTNDDGILITPMPLLSGDYEIEEIDTAGNYLLSSERMPFEIKTNSLFIEDETYGTLIEVYFENTKVKGQVEIYKTGERIKFEGAPDSPMVMSYFNSPLRATFLNNSNENTNNKKYEYIEIPLPEVVFGIYDEEDNLVDILITNNDGYAISNELELGKYYLKEESSSNNNLLDETEYEFVLEFKDNKTPIITKTFNLKNYLGRGTLEFSKTDLVNGKEISNVKLEIYTEDNILAFSGITDENGKIVIDDLPFGKYYIKETEAATGYLLSDEIVFFEIKEDGEIVKANMTNEKITGELHFKKSDFSTSDPLPNTLIEIYNEETDELVFSGRTDEFGEIIIHELEYGKYYILEKEAPVGYTLNPEKMNFEIKEDGEIVKAEMLDERISGVLKIHKVDSNNEALEGVKIGVYDLEDNLLETLITDENGDVELYLEYGSYYYQEIETIEGHILNDEKVYFNIDEDGIIFDCVLVNEIDVPITLIYDFGVIEIISLCFIIIGIGGIYCGIRKKNKK